MKSDNLKRCIFRQKWTVFLAEFSATVLMLNSVDFSLVSNCLNSAKNPKSFWSLIWILCELGYWAWSPCNWTGLYVFFFSVCKEWRREIEKIKSSRKKMSWMLYDSAKRKTHDDHSPILDLGWRIQVSYSLMYSQHRLIRPKNTRRFSVELGGART